tara:strand:+ start:1129 stop:1350 length:222 start_codon:yes stop_codon:yes gene_type:complete
LLLQENAMPLSARDTMERMRGTTFCVAPTGDSDGFTQRFYYILAAGCIPVRVETLVRLRARVEADPNPTRPWP